MIDGVTRQGFDEQRLERVGAVGRRYVDDGKLPFSMVQVARRGEVVYRDDYGWADIEAERAIEADSIVRIYSMTKPLTSIALMQLYEAGEVLLENPISRFIPEFADVEVFDGGEGDDLVTRPTVRVPTLKDILTHQSGFTYGFMFQTPIDALYREQGIGNLTLPDYSLTEGMKRLSEIPLLFDPGTKWNYSVSTDVVGRVVEVVSGQSLDRYLAEHVVDPLGMVDTGFHVRDGQAHRFVDNHTTAATLAEATGKDLDGEPWALKRIDQADTSPYLDPPMFVSGGGGMVSTMADYQRFCDMLLNRGELDGERIIGPRTLDYMTLNHLTDHKTLNESGQSLFSEVTLEGMGFGLGFSPVVDTAANGNLTNPGEYSWGGAASTAFWIDPVEELTAIFLTQLLPSSTYPLRRQLRAAVYQALVD